MPVIKIVSGGQTGVDRAALDFAIKHGVECGGWCPKGRKADDGIIPEHYPLEETGVKKPAKRTELNVINSDGTLIITCNNELIEGSKLTEEYCKKLNKPCLCVDISHTKTVMKNRFDNWVEQHNIAILNIAGNKEVECCEIYTKTIEILEFLWNVE